MIHVQIHPLALPDWLVHTYRLDLAALYSAGWGVDHYDVAFSPSGEMYALYGVYRHASQFDDWDGDKPENQPQDPAGRNFGYRMITRYGADGMPLATALCCGARPDGTPSAITNGGDMRLSVLPDGNIVVSAHPDCTYILAPSLDTVLAAYTMPLRWPFEEVVAGDPFATWVRVTPSGRLLGVVTEYGVHEFGSSIPNLLAFADGPLTVGNKPVLEAIASLDPRPAHQTEAADLRPHVRHQGRPVGLEHRPHPALIDLVPRNDEERYRYGRASIGVPEPLDDDLFVLPVLGQTYRGGSRGQPFAFTLINDKGEVTGHLKGLDYWDDSPFTGSCFTVVTDPRRGRAFHLNRYGLYAWSRDGEPQARLGTAEKPFKSLTQFALLAGSPQGELVLAHRKQHLLLRITLPESLGDLAETVEGALRTYAHQRTALKKAWSPTNWHWTFAPGPGGLHHL